MKKNILQLILIALLFLCTISTGTAKNKTEHELLKKQKSVQNVYRFYVGEQVGRKIWIVDGAVIRRELFNEFLYGGNSERYPFVPENEVWIENGISAEEYEYTLAHELNEIKLMARGFSYTTAHDSSLMLELKMRRFDAQKALEIENLLPRVSSMDCDSIKQIPGIADSITLKNIFLQKIGERENVSIWIVNGATVRREIYPDFGLSGNDLVYYFIPKKQIWIDAHVTCEEMEYSISSELEERALMGKGVKYDEAYTEAIKLVGHMRNKENILCKKHLPVFVPKILTREIGTGKEKEVNK